MKKFNIISGLMIGVAFAFTSCDKDLDNNPVLQTPSSFTLNTPSYAASNIDLANTDSIAFTWSQPDYGFPVTAQYQILVSSKNKWDISTDVASADESGETLADYGSVCTPTNLCNANISADAVDKVLEQCEHWDENNVPATQKLYVRAMSVLNNDTIYSNVVSMDVIPYFYLLTDAAPDIWYLTGSCIADGSWGADQVIPLYTVAGMEYDKRTGAGEFTWTGYLNNSGFKLRKKASGDDMWDNQWGQGDSFGTFVYNDAGSGNIVVPENGFYTITLNTATEKLTIVKAEITPDKYTTITIPGTGNGWDQISGNAMSPITTVDGVESHDWKATVTYTEDGEFKFANGTWDINWGNGSFPYGTGVIGGGNIQSKAGTYTVFFNDITGQYNFIAQ